MKEPDTDPEAVNAILRAQPVRRRYTAAPGERLELELPRVPYARDTMHVRFAREVRGDADCFAEEPEPRRVEGALLPRRIAGRAVRPGRFELILRAVNDSTGEEIEGVEPLRIEVEVRE